MKHDYGQYFTPRGVALLMAGLLKAPRAGQVLEPSAGEGVFIDALRELGFSNITALEIDPRLVEQRPKDLIQASFINWSPEQSFNSVIGNPPYIRWKNLETELQNEVKLHPLWGQLFNALSDYLTVFIANSILHLKEGGELVFITPSFWMHTQHSSNLRNWMLEQGQFTDLITFGESKVFDGVSSSLIIFRYEKALRSSHNITHYEYVGPHTVPTMLDLRDRSLFECSEIPAFQLGSHWTIATIETQQLLNHFEQSCTTRSQDSETLFSAPTSSRLGHFVDIANGMVSGLDAAFKIPTDVAASLSESETAGTAKVYKGKNLRSYFPHQSSLYIHLPKGLTEKDVLKDYPTLYSLLLPYKEKLLKRYSYGKELPFWEWAFLRSESFHKNGERKIFVPCKERMTNKRTARFALADGSHIATQDVTALSPKTGVRESIEYVLAYLNQPVVSDWIRVRGLMKGGIAEFSEAPLEAIPFRAIDWTNPQEVKIHDSIVDEVCKMEVENDNSHVATIEALFRKLSISD